MKRPHYHWLAIALACITGYAQAHGDMEKIQDALSAPNGGRLRLSGQYYIELVAQPRQLTVHAMHADTKVPVDLTLASGAAIVLLDGKKEVVDLAPTGTQLSRRRSVCLSGKRHHRGTGEASRWHPVER
jgi:hypothetical protein